MIKHLNLNNQQIAQRALEIQKLAYRIEADLIDFDGIPQLHESLEDLQASSNTFIGYFVDGILAGVLAYEIDHSTLDIDRLVIHPDYFRRGIGRALGNYVADIPNITRWIVATGAKNTPARRLYEALDYRLQQEITLREGVAIVHYEKIHKA